MGVTANAAEEKTSRRRLESVKTTYEIQTFQVFTWSALGILGILLMSMNKLINMPLMVSFYCEILRETFGLLLVKLNFHNTSSGCTLFSAGYPLVRRIGQNVGRLMYTAYLYCFISE